MDKPLRDEPTFGTEFVFNTAPVLERRFDASADVSHATTAFLSAGSGSFDSTREHGKAAGTPIPRGEIPTADALQTAMTSAIRECGGHRGYGGPLMGSGGAMPVFASSATATGARLRSSDAVPVPPMAMVRAPLPLPPPPAVVALPVPTIAYPPPPPMMPVYAAPPVPIPCALPAYTMEAAGYASPYYVQTGFQALWK
jgi:hypothetical protein